MDRTYLGLLLIFTAAIVVAFTIYAGYIYPGFFAAGAACGILLVITLHRTLKARIEEKILRTGLIQQYLVSNFTVDESTLNYLIKLLREDYHLTVSTPQLLSAIEKEQTARELEREKEELQDFKSKFYIKEVLPTVDEYVKQFVTVFGRGSPRNVYSFMKVLEEKDITFTQEKEFTDRVIALKNLVEAEIEERGGAPKKEEHITVTVCPTCGNEYPRVLLFCPFCERKTTPVSAPRGDVVYCPQCKSPMVRSILKKGDTYVKGYQCRNLKCLYEVTHDEPHHP